MIKEGQEIEISITFNNYKYYQEKGYDAIINTKMKVKAEDLSLNNEKNHFVAICDVGGEETVTTMRTYNRVKKKHNGLYLCSSCSRKTKEYEEKIHKTCLEKYGVENPSQSEEIKTKKEQTCLKNYGVKYWVLDKKNAEIIQEKRVTTLYKNGTTPTSSQQLQLYELLSTEFPNDIVELNYPVSKLNLDVLVIHKDVPIDVEYDCCYWHQNQQKDIKRDKVVNSFGYKVLRIKARKKIPPAQEIKDKIDELINSQHKYAEIICEDYCLLEDKD